MEGQGSRTLLLEALQALYHHPDPQIRTAANRWLDEFQHTMEAWQAWLPNPLLFLLMEFFISVLTLK
jgi:transportin-3